MTSISAPKLFCYKCCHFNHDSSNRRTICLTNCWHLLCDQCHRGGSRCILCKQEKVKVVVVSDSNDLPPKLKHLFMSVGDIRKEHSVDRMAQWDKNIKEVRELQRKQQEKLLEVLGKCKETEKMSDKKREDEISKIESFQRHHKMIWVQRGKPPSMSESVLKSNGVFKTPQMPGSHRRQNQPEMLNSSVMNESFGQSIPRMSDQRHLTRSLAQSFQPVSTPMLLNMSFGSTAAGSSVHHPPPSVTNSVQRTPMQPVPRYSQPCAGFAGQGRLSTRLPMWNSNRTVPYSCGTLNKENLMRAALVQSTPVPRPSERM